MSTRCAGALLVLFYIHLLGCANRAGSPVAAPHPAHADATAFGVYHALIIANSDYENHLDVGAPLRDAEALSKILTEQYGYQVRPILFNADERRIRAAFAQLATLQENDRLLLYFSGHGEADVGGSGGYWLPVDARAPSPTERAAQPGVAEASAGWISREEIVHFLGELRPTQIIVVDDSCYSGAAGMLQQRAGLPTPSGPVPAVALAESQQREAITARVEIAEVGYAEIGKLTSKRVRLWLSAGGNEPVASGGLGRSESLFTKHFLATLHDSEGIMDSHEIFSSIHERMKGAPESQMPELSPLFTAKHGGGQFLFVKKTWSADDIDSRLGRVTVRVVGNGGQADADRASLVKDLVIEQLRQSDGDSPALRPDAQPRPLFIAVSFTQRHELELTLVDRETLQVLGKVSQALATDPEDLADNVAAALLTLRRRAEKELQGKEISVDIVKRALVAQRTQTWDYHLTIGVSAYVDLDGGGLLNEPAGSVRMGANRNLTPWFLLGAALGFDWTKAKSSRQSVIGDLDDGTYSNNRLTGQLTLHTYSAMLRATFRQSHGLVLPFVYVSAGVAGLDADLTDERIKPATPSDTLPLDLINRRDVNDVLAFAWETGLGLNFLVTEGVSFVGEAHFFKAHHEMRISSQIEGVNEASVLRTDFPSVQAASARAGVGFFF